VEQFLNGDEWCRARFGEQGPHLRQIIPLVVRNSHDALADAHEAVGLRGQQVYGNIWLKTLESLVQNLGTLPGSTIVRPGRAPYSLVTFGKTVIFAWRYAREAGQSVEEASFGSVSPTRQEIFRGFPDDPQMSLWELESDPVDGNDSEEVAADLLRDGHQVVVVAYASNSSRLFALEWGDAELVADGLPLAWGFRESMSLETASGDHRLISLGHDDEGPAFNDGPLPEPDLYAKGEEADDGTVAFGGPGADDTDESGVEDFDQ
jgi:hypothetical protein